MPSHSFTCGMWDVSLAKEANATLVNVVQHPVDGQCYLLLHCLQGNLQPKSALFECGWQCRSWGQSCCRHLGAPCRRTCNSSCLSQKHPGHHRMDVWEETGLGLGGGGFIIIFISFLTSLFGLDTQEQVTQGALHRRQHCTSHTPPPPTYFWHRCTCCIARSCKRRRPWWLVFWVVAPQLFVLCVVEGEGWAIKCTQAQPGHIGDCWKALLNVRTSLASYQVLDIAIKEKQDGAPLIHA